jgi:hypothetical protein
LLLESKFQLFCLQSFCAVFCFWERIGGRFLAAFGAFAAAAAFGNCKGQFFLHLQGLWNYICFGKSFVFLDMCFLVELWVFLGNCDQIVECWKACVGVVVVVLLLLCLMMIHDMFVVVS